MATRLDYFYGRSFFYLIDDDELNVGDDFHTSSAEIYLGNSEMLYEIGLNAMERLITQV